MSRWGELEAVETPLEPICVREPICDRALTPEEYKKIEKDMNIHHSETTNFSRIPVGYPKPVSGVKYIRQVW